MGAGTQEKYKHTIPPARSIDVFKVRNEDGTVETYIERINVSSLRLISNLKKLFKAFRRSLTYAARLTDLELSIHALYHIRLLDVPFKLSRSHSDSTDQTSKQALRHYVNVEFQAS